MRCAAKAKGLLMVVALRSCCNCSLERGVHEASCDKRLKHLRRSRYVCLLSQEYGFAYCREGPVMLRQNLPMLALAVKGRRGPWSSASRSEAHEGRCCKGVAGSPKRTCLNTACGLSCWGSSIQLAFFSASKWPFLMSRLTHCIVSAKSRSL